MKIIYHTTDKDLKRMFRTGVQVLPHLKKLNRLYSFGVVFIFMIIVSWIIEIEFISSVFIYLIISVLFYFYFFALFLYINYKKSMPSSSRSNVLVTLELTEEQIIQTQGLVERRISWDKIYKTVEKKSEFLIFPSKEAFEFIIVKKDFLIDTPSEEHTLKSYLEKSLIGRIVKEKRFGRV